MTIRNGHIGKMNVDAVIIYNDTTLALADK